VISEAKKIGENQTMRKLLMATASLVLTAGIASATAIQPVNVQSAYIDTDRDWQVKVDYNYFRNHSTSGGTEFRNSTMELPRIDIRKSFDTSIPVRIGLNTAVSLGSTGTETAGVQTETGALGFGNLGLTLEAGLINEKDFAVTAYINQHFALIHNSSMVGNAFRPTSGANAYGFQTGLELSANLIEGITWYGDWAYRFDVPDAGEVQNAFVYWNELVWDTGTIVNPTLGILGTSVYNSGVGTDLRLVPGWVNNFGDDNAYQLRVGFPIGLTSDSTDFGVQVGLFAAM